MSTETVLYAEINIASIVLLIILSRPYWRKDLSQEDKRLGMVIVASGFFVALDLAWYLINGREDIPVWVNYTVNSLYFVLIVVAPYLWSFYSDLCLKIEVRKNLLKRFLIALPVMAVFVMVVMSWWNGCIFYVDENNVYHRGDYIIAQTVVSVMYFIVPAIQALIVMKKGETHELRKRARSMASFIIFPLIGSAFQYFIPELPVLCITLSLSLAMIISDKQMMNITSDELTKTNNRSKLMEYLNSRIANQGELDEDFLYVIMLNVRNLQQINEKIGRLEGDEALRHMAGTFSEICTRENAFIARYAGDRFVIVKRFRNDEEANELVALLKNSAKRTEVEGFGRLSVSAGYANHKRGMSATQLLACAETWMYEDYER